MPVLFLQIIILAVLLFFFQFFITQIYNLVFRGYAPFVGTNKKALARILAEIKIGRQSLVYELGAGQAGFLRALRQKYPEAKLVGIEIAFLPWLIGNIQSALGRHKIDFSREDVFKTDLGQADLLYCYLNEKTMAGLEEKFTRELNPGAQVLSYQFALPNKAAEKEIDLDKAGRVWIYRY